MRRDRAFWIAMLIYALLILAVALFAQPPAPGGAAVATATINVLLNGKLIGSTPILNFEPNSSAPSGVLGSCAPNPTLGSIDCGFNINSVLTATLDQVHANQLFCDSTNGTTQYTCTMPSKALLAYARGNAFLLAVDTTCTTGCSVNVDSLGALNLYQSDGMNTASGTPVAGGAAWVWYDGKLLRLM